MGCILLLYRERVPEGPLRVIKQVSIAEYGFTLIELMIACAILSILLFLSVPLLHLGGRTIAWQTAEHLRLDIELAKLQASTHYQFISICPTQDLSTCQDIWHRDYLVMNITENTPFSVQKLPKEITLQYRGFPDSDVMDFPPAGHLASNGTFSVLYRGKLYYQVIVNHGGRVKIESS
jgi:prepilin-type N-terminal cleavage/methylation domain-containing protein